MRENEICLGEGLGKQTVGCCDRGTIYDGFGWNHQIVGRYYDHAVYGWDGHTEVWLGTYGKGQVHRKVNGEFVTIGSYDESGKIYRGWDWLTRIPIGNFSGDEACAAAALLIFDEGADVSAPAPAPIEAGSGEGGGISGLAVLAFLGFCALAIFFWWFMVTELQGSSSRGTYIAWIGIVLGSVAFSIVILKLREFGEIFAASALISIAVLIVNILLFDRHRPADYGLSNWLTLLLGIPLAQSAACALPSGLAAIIISMVKKRRAR